MGSVATAGSMILERLAGSGHAVDLFAIDGFIRPAELIGLDRIDYVPIRVGPLRAGWRAVEAIPGPARKPATVAYSAASDAAHLAAIDREIGRRHAASPYDLLLVLGLLSPFRVAGLPCLSWPQGTPLGEWQALRRLREQVVKFGGWPLYLGLKSFYALRRRQSRSRVGHSAAIACASRWAAEGWAEFGVPPDRIFTCPYPLDLDLIRPGPRDRDRPTGPFRFLWLGRIVPRKRLDLAIDALRLLRRDRPEATLTVVGRVAYCRGYERLLAEAVREGGVEHLPSVPRHEVPGLLHASDAILQPSENEEIGSAVLEGLAAGLPAVLGPTNGTRDYTGSAGFSFDAYTPESVRDAMIGAMDAARTDRDGLAAAARAEAESHLGPEAVLARFEQILAAVIDRNRPSLRAGPAVD